MAVVWNITRAADDADEMARALEAQGVSARSLPCIAREKLAWPALPPDALLFLTSAAVLPLPDDARDNPVAALGRVASALRRAGREVLVDSDGGVVSLASRLAEVFGALAANVRLRLVYPTSDLAHEQLEHTEALYRLTRFADVSVHAVYRVVPPAELERALLGLRPESGLVFFSPSAVKHFFAAAAQVPPPRAVVTHGASTLRAWEDARPRGWPDAVAHAREQPLADTLKRFS
jgi:uroporphyrinogen-III synthase